MKKHPAPTRDEVTAARKVLRRHFREQSKKRRAAVRLDEPSLAFRTWTHDMRVLLPAVVRERPKETAHALASFCAAAADRMALTVEARKPTSGDGLTRFARRYRGQSARDRWEEWQETFDALVHSLSLVSSLGSEAVIRRAAEVADAAHFLIDKRRPRSR